MVDDEDQHVLRLLAWRSFDERSAEFWRRVDAQSATSCGEALRDGKRVTIVDTEQYEQLAHTPDLDEYRRSGIRSVQSTPLVSRTGQFLGVVSTHWRRPHAATSGELRVFDVLVRQAADQVERARVDRRQREADRRKDNFLAMLGHELRNPLAPLTSRSLRSWRCWNALWGRAFASMSAHPTAAA